MTKFQHPLFHAVVYQMGDQDAFEASVHDIYTHGIQGGYGGFFYYTETVAFTVHHKAKILNLLQQEAADFGTTPLQLLCSFTCLRGLSLEEVAEGLYKPRSDFRSLVFNALAWYAAESVCRAWVEFYEE